MALRSLTQGQQRRDKRGQIEARKDGQTVAGCEEGVSDSRDRTGGRCRGAEEAGELRVFVQAQREVCGRGGEEFVGAGGDA